MNPRSVRDGTGWFVPRCVCRFVYASIVDSGPDTARQKRQGSAAMKNRLLVAAGALIVLVGAIWTLQGLGVVGGSAMSGVTLWAVVGPVVVVVGIAVAATGMRGRSSRP